MKRAMELEPLAIQQGANYAAVLMYARRFDEAIQQARRTCELDPDHIGARNWLCYALNAKGRYAEAQAIGLKSSTNLKRPRLVLKPAKGQPIYGSTEK
jgi:hypothetical protein